MAAGGYTFETAGILDLGSDNTFDTDGATGGDLVDEGHWTLTRPDWSVVTITTGTPQVRLLVRFPFGDAGLDQEVAYVDHTNGTAKFIAEPGIEYHVIAGQPASLGIETYTLTYAATTSGVATSTWSTEWRDRTDNFLIFSAAGAFHGELMAENPHLYDTINGGVFPPDWFFTVVETLGNEVDGDRVGPPSREGAYEAEEVLDGDDPISADGCVWEHVKIGDRGFQFWNADPDDSHHLGPAVCRDVPASFTPATPRPPDFFPQYDLTYDASSPGLPATMSGTERKVARGAWFLPVRDNLGPEGAFDLADLDVTGLLPDGYTGPVFIEWDGEHPDFVRVDCTADKTDRSTPDPIPTKFHLNVDTDVLPTYGSGAWSDHWSIGVLGTEVVPGPPTRKMRFTSDGSGTASWNHITALLDWDDCASWPDDAPDVIVGMELDDLDTTPPIDSDGAGAADIAFRVTVRARRFRVRYFQATTTIPPRRIFGRSDGATHGARRTLGGGNTRQSGSRTLGSIL